MVTEKRQNPWISRRRKEAQSVNMAENEKKQAPAKSDKPGKETQAPEEGAYFPLFFSLKEKTVLVVGAGKIAARRALSLAEFEANVLVIAPDGAGQMDEMAREGMVRWEKRHFEDRDVEGCWLAVAATDDPAVNEQVVRLCRERRILVNHAGDKSQCDFYFPGTARDGNLVVGVTASGKDHRLAAQATRQLKVWIKQLHKEN